jgi:lipoyl-dependent peroxiredoxin
MSQPLYHTSATTKGGRNGRTSLDQGGLALAMSLPKEMGGAGDGMNPEQLFALGYSSCFGQAILAMGKKHGVDTSTAQVTAAVSLDKDDVSFMLSVTLSVRIPGVEADTAKAIVEDAHQICPYSRATRGNIAVTVQVA